MARLHREMNRLFDAFSLAGGRTAPGYPEMNVWTNEEGALVTAELPGDNPEDIGGRHPDLYRQPPTGEAEGGRNVPFMSRP
jgi:hypothetical protein